MTEKFTLSPPTNNNSRKSGGFYQIGTQHEESQTMQYQKKEGTDQNSN
jgi:hypothetical protein